MINVSIASSDLQKALNDMRKYPIEVKKGIKDEIKRTSWAVTNKAQQNLKNNKNYKTGRLSSSMPAYAGKNMDLERFQAKAGTDVFYGPYVELGTPPHIIEVKRAKVLAKYMGTSGGKANFKIFGKKVHHPGTRPSPFLMPAAESERSRFNSNCEKILSDSTGTK